MPSRIAEFVPLFMVLSSLASSVLSVTVAFAAFRHTSRFQDVDYRQHQHRHCASSSLRRGCEEHFVANPMYSDFLLYSPGERLHRLLSGHEPLALSL